MAAPERPDERIVPPAPTAGPTPGALVRLMRPRQWIKNLLVFASPAAAGVLDEPEHAGRAALVFVAFCLAASGAYCLNDVADAEADRQHPLKRSRPVASGQVAPAVAVPMGIALLLAGLGVAGLTGSWAPVGIVALYVALQPAYTYWLKHVAVIDLVVVSAGFVLRAVAGVVGTDVPISDWYLIVASFGSLFLVAGKRSSELRLGDAAAGHRRSLDVYTPSFLLLVRAVSVSITLLAYCLWAFEKADVANLGFPWFQLSIVPFSTLLLRYALAHESSELAGPEDIVLGDRQLQVIGLVWAGCLAAGVYIAGAPPLSG
ncbi:MAG: decaprenyl-phosphate phosphoribosyltransferase [Acidimicrobiales bacterium]